MDTNLKLYVSGESAAQYKSSLEVEQEARQERKKGRRRQGRRRRFPNYSADKSIDQESFDKYADNRMNNLNNRQNGIRKPSTGAITNTKSSGPSTLEGLRRRHDQLEAQIKKMKKDIAKHQESVEKEPERKTAETEKEDVASKKEDVDEMELDV
jgi:hypothetical protein